MFLLSCNCVLAVVKYTDMLCYVKNNDKEPKTKKTLAQKVGFEFWSMKMVVSCSRGRLYDADCACTDKTPQD